MKDSLESGKRSFILKKSYEVSYALWRVAANTQERNFAGMLFGNAIELISLVADGRYEAVFGKLEGIETLIRFGVDINELSVANGEILVREIGNLKSAMPIESGKIDDVYIADIFEPTFEIPEEDIPATNFENMENIEMEESGKESGNTNMKSENRQAAILERIRQIGNCRLGDIQTVLPDCSERTIRYDLESLVQRNLIERFGTGGRSVYYRIK